MATEVPPVPDLLGRRFAVVDDGQEIVIMRGGTTQAFILRVRRKQISLELPLAVGGEMAGNVVLAFADIDERMREVVLASPGIFAVRLVQQMLVEVVQGQIVETTTDHKRKTEGRKL